MNQVTRGSKHTNTFIRMARTTVAITALQLAAGCGNGGTRDSEACPAGFVQTSGGACELEGRPPLTSRRLYCEMNRGETTRARIPDVCMQISCGSERTLGAVFAEITELEPMRGLLADLGGPGAIVGGRFDRSVCNQCNATSPAFLLECDDAPAPEPSCPEPAIACAGAAMGNGHAAGETFTSPTTIAGYTFREIADDPGAATAARYIGLPNGDTALEFVRSSIEITPPSVSCRVRIRVAPRGRIMARALDSAGQVIGASVGAPTGTITFEGAIARVILDANGDEQYLQSVCATAER